MRYLLLLLTALTSYGQVVLQNAVLQNAVLGGGAAGGGGSLVVAGTNSSRGTAGSATVALTSVPAGALLVLLSGSEAADTTHVGGSPSSTPSLTWAQVTNVAAANVGSTAIHIATFAAGGDITVLSDFNGGVYQAATLISVTGQEASWGGQKSTSLNASASAPSVSITPRDTDSILFAVNCDYAAVNGTITFTATPVTGIFDQWDSGRFRFNTWYKTGASGATAMGESAPNTQQWGMAVIEIRK